MSSSCWGVPSPDPLHEDPGTERQDTGASKGIGWRVETGGGRRKAQVGRAGRQPEGRPELDSSQSGEMSPRIPPALQ